MEMKWIDSWIGTWEDDCWDYDPMAGRNTHEKYEEF